MNQIDSVQAKATFFRQTRIEFIFLSIAIFVEDSISD